MTTLHSTLKSAGGVASTARLLRRGFTARELAEAVRSGTIQRVRQGWYALPETPRDVTTAVRVGGSLACVSALRRAGIWLPFDSRIHVAVPAHASRLRVVPSAVVHWCAPADAEFVPVIPLAEALGQAAVCLPAEFALVAIDSALNKSLVTLPQLERAFALLPARARRLLDLPDAKCDSGLETLARYRLRRWRIRVRTQVRIPGVGRVDVVVGERLVLEFDGRGFHDDDDSFEEDRRRDRELHRLGYIVVRLSYTQVMQQWQRAEEVIREMVRRRDHMWPRSGPHANSG